MNIDHVFVTIEVTDGDLTGLVLLRTDRKGKPLAAVSKPIAKPVGKQDYADCIGEAIDDAKAVIFHPSYDHEFVMVANDLRYLQKHLLDVAKPLFSSAKRLDILQLAWPLCYNDIIPSGTFTALCKHFQIPIGKNAAEECESLSRVYWAVMRRYKTSLAGEEVVREFGGSALAKVRGLIGI